jgi:hypothetical protein
MSLALTVAFFAALPVNLYLLNRGRGHALTHQYHEVMDHQGTGHQGSDHGVQPARREHAHHG